MAWIFIPGQKFLEYLPWAQSKQKKFMNTNIYPELTQGKYSRNFGLEINTGGYSL